MYKAKLRGLVMACMVVLFGITPVTAFAAETNTESVTMSDHKEKKAAFEKEMKKANDKWNTLSENQKNEVYALLENKIQEEFKIMDKLVEFGVMEKADVDNYKTHMNDRFHTLKESGSFPLLRQRGNKSR